MMPGIEKSDFDTHYAARGQNNRYVWVIAIAAALGGLLFGYDWVVIGGARQFFEIYFHLESAAQVGWANSCALVGCLLGSMSAGPLATRYGRKRVLLLSAILFAVSSGLTGSAMSFAAFVTWRIAGGVAIGLSSSVSPLYIAEVSPAALRGRLVSLNQFAIVVGILMAQIVNWLIARPVPLSLTASERFYSWNVQFGWRWMFFAVIIPSAVFAVASAFVPESPRWLVIRDRREDAGTVLSRIGGTAYAESELVGIESTLTHESRIKVSRRELFSKGLRKILLIGICLAVLQQWTGINVIFNYAGDIYRNAGFGTSQVFLDIVVTGVINLAFTVLAMVLVDRVGRRPLMIIGCLGIGVSHCLCALAYYANWPAGVVLTLTLSAIACYAVTLAPITWVLISEIFPNRIRSQAVSISVSALWIASFALTYTFPIFSDAIGTQGTFLMYGVICFVGCIFSVVFVPETKGRSLEQLEVDLRR